IAHRIRNGPCHGRDIEPLIRRPSVRRSLVGMFALHCIGTRAQERSYSVTRSKREGLAGRERQNRVDLPVAENAIHYAVSTAGPLAAAKRKLVVCAIDKAMTNVPGGIGILA